MLRYAEQRLPLPWCTRTVTRLANIADQSSSYRRSAAEDRSTDLPLLLQVYIPLSPLRISRQIRNAEREKPRQICSRDKRGERRKR